MDWAPRIKPIKIRRLYRYARLGIYDDTLLHDVGWELYARCTDIATVADVYRGGRVPCPECRTKVARRIDPLYSSGEGGTHENWFHCPHCTERLLWRDCRQFLRDTPRCFECLAVLQKTDELLCTCGTLNSKFLVCKQHQKIWSQKAYNQSVRTRVRLPCPHCLNLVRRPDADATFRTVKSRQPSPELQCPKCQEVARHLHGNIECTACGYKRRWRDYRKSLKKKDEKLECPNCEHTFKWQAWRKSTRSLRTGNPRPAREFLKKWLKCRTPQARMIQIDTLLQTLHGRGPLAPLFIDSGERNIRHMLDDLAS